MNKRKSHLPLKAIECRFQASGPALDVQIDQVFQQSARRPLDVIYSFPLPSKAAVYRCEMIVNGRTIRAKVVEQEAARKIAAQKKAEGRRTALVGDAEKVAIAQDEVYQPSLDVQSGVLYARSPAFLSASASFCFQSKVTEYRKAVLAPCSDEELVSDIFDLKETRRLTEQLNRTIESAFCPPDAKKLASIMQDWAKHTDEKQVRDALCALLQECEHDSDAGHLRKLLSDFFLGLPDPWQTEAASIFAAQATKLIQSAAAETK